MPWLYIDILRAKRIWSEGKFPDGMIERKTEGVGKLIMYSILLGARGPRRMFRVPSRSSRASEDNRPIW